MQEYTIKIKCNGGTPYFLYNYKSFNECYAHLIDMIILEEERGRPYFVDNNFFNNKYKNCTNLKYFKILVRDVSEWFDYDENNSKNEKNNIIYFNKFQKSNCNY